MMGDLRVEAVTRTMESPLGNRSQSVPKWKLPTGEPYAGKPPVRFGGRGGESLPYPYRVQGWQSSCYGKPCHKFVASRPCDWIPASLLE